MTFELFPESAGPPPDPPDAPLAERMRPLRLDEVAGQRHLLREDGFLRRLVAAGRVPSLLLWGPPGSGKTTLARVLAAEVPGDFIALSAVSAGLKEVREAVARAADNRRLGRRTYLFLDEIHRFNRAQQDALLPHVEAGTLVLIGATTENPSFEVNAALLSRLRVLTLEPLPPEDLSRLADRALADPVRGLHRAADHLTAEARSLLVRAADGDARRLLNVLESAASLAPAEGAIDDSHIAQSLQRRTLRFDKSGEEHYNLVSALHKSIRDSDADGALYWLARLLAGGEDRLFVARRLVRMAAEDVGLADPQALALAIAARDSFHFLGEPEGDLGLAQAAVYLALAPKSNAVYTAWGRAWAEAVERGSLPVPMHLRNAPTQFMKSEGYGRGYRYAHDFPGGTVRQAHLPGELEGERFYEPTGRGFERELRRRMEELRATWGEATGGADESPGDPSGDQ